MATKVQGLASLATKLKKLAPETRSALRQALAENADELVAAQKNLAPVDSGALRDSITQTWGGGPGPSYAAFQKRSGRAASPVSGDPDLSVRISAGNTKVRYAHLIEFGTAPHKNGGKFAGTQHPGTAAAPFFYPAYRALRKRMKARLTRATTRAAKKVAGA